MEYQGYDISSNQNLIPRLQRLLHVFRSGGFQVYHTREGKLFSGIEYCDKATDYFRTST